MKQKMPKSAYHIGQIVASILYVAIAMQYILASVNLTALMNDEPLNSITYTRFYTSAFVYILMTAVFVFVGIKKVSKWERRDTVYSIIAMILCAPLGIGMFVLLFRMTH